MSISKKQALSVVYSGADAYEENLANKSLLFLSVDKHFRTHCMEASFNESNFNHLTRLRTKLTANEFFSACHDRRLSDKSFWFAPDGTTELKLKVLPAIVKRDLSARMIGSYNDSRPLLYTEMLAGGVNACVGFERDKKNGSYVPNTLLKEDIRKLVVGRPQKIILTCRKGQGDSRYSEAVYAAKDIDWDRLELPTEHAYLKSLA